VLKRFFIDLPTPLFPPKFYDTYLEVAKASENEPEQVNPIQSIIEKLPLINQKIIEYLFEFIVQVSQHSDENQMVPSNLGIVFGPTLVRAEGDDPMKLIHDGKYINDFITCVINQYPKIFGMRHIESIDQLYHIKEDLGSLRVLLDHSKNGFLGKCIPLDHIESFQRKRTQSRISRTKNYSHPNMLRVQKLCVTKKNLWVVMSFTETQLFDIVASSLESYSERDVVLLSRQIVSAIKYCHKRGFAHGNIQTDTLLCELIDTTNLAKKSSPAATAAASSDDTAKKQASTSWKVKIWGAGFNRFLTEASQTSNITPFSAPEVVSGGRPTKASDMWSVGVAVYALLTGRMPFSGDSQEALKKNILKGDVDMQQMGDVSSFAKEFVIKLIKLDPAKRITVSKAAKHPFLRKLGSQASDVQLTSAMSNLRETLDLRSIMENRKK